MTKKEIREYMLKHINERLETAMDELDIANLVTEDMVYDYMWQKDFGEELVEEFINEHTEEMVEEYLDNIYESIETEDLEV